LKKCITPSTIKTMPSLSQTSSMALRTVGTGSAVRSARAIAEIDEIEADHQQVIDGIGQLTIALKGINQETATVAV
jgi:O-glycosyl hydrolase